jgi:glycosyltransferase involved in cell wall biosynthesis
MNRICFVVGSLDIGGTEGHLVRILPHLKDLGWDPMVFCLSREGTQADQLKAVGIPIYVGAEGPKQSRSPFARGFRLFKAAWNFFLLMLRQRPQIVHFFLPEAYLLGAPLALVRGIRIRIMSRRSLNLYQQHWPAARWLEPQLHRHMTAIVGNSRAVVENLLGQEGCKQDQVGLIYNGVRLGNLPNPKAIRDLTMTLGIEGARFTAIMTANLIAYKGHADLLRAFHLVRDKLPQPWVLLLAGRDDGEGPKLREEAHRLGIQSCVHFLGPRGDVPSLMQLADIGVLSSHEEGFSNAVLEGMASGLPMVVTDVGGNAEAVLDHITGFVVPARDPSSLANAILNLALSEDLRRVFGAHARARAENSFSLERCVDNYDRLYRGLVDGQRVGDIDGIGIGRP